MLSSRLAPTAATLALLLLFGLVLGPYWLNYFPYEDDFSLLRYSAAENHPQASDWVRKGFAEYFANDPSCSLGGWGFARPVVNLTHYLESFLSPQAEGLRPMVTNLAVWLISVWLVYGIARRLGASAWIAAAGMVLFGTSPCWFRVLLHSSFRNNGLAACWILGAFYVLLGDTGLRQVWRLLAVGCLAALSVTSHEQGLTNLPVLALCCAWFYWENRGTATAAKMAAGLTAVLLPSVLAYVLIRSLNVSYGANYATAGFADLVNRSSRIEAMGITNPMAVKLIKLAGQAVKGILGAPMAFAPTGADNLAAAGRLWGFGIFALAAAAGFLARRWWPRAGFVWMVVLLYAAGRNLAGFSEPRFTHLEVAWATLALVGALSAMPGGGKGRLILVTGLAAACGLLAFNLISFRATIFDHRGDLLQREAADRASFQKIASMAAQYPNAQFVFANEQTGMWSARPMLEMAGHTNGRTDLLPTINEAWSTDFLKAYRSCPVVTEVARSGAGYELVMRFAASCRAYTYGRNLECTAAHYRDRGQSHAAEWTACAAPGLKEGDCGTTIRHEIRQAPGEAAVVFYWKDRLSVVEATVLAALAQAE